MAPYKLTLQDKIHYVFFLTHIPITLMFDSQALAPPDFFPSVIRDVAAQYCEELKDPFMCNPRPWFQSLITCELAFQLPFFFAALYAMHTGGSWIRLPGIIYSAHVCTTLMPVLAEVFFGVYANGPETLMSKLTLFVLYSPYFFIPLWYGISLLRRPHPYVTPVKTD